jgi:hypothetical protein
MNATRSNAGQKQIDGHWLGDYVDIVWIEWLIDVADVFKLYSITFDWRPRFVAAKLKCQH